MFKGNQDENCLSQKKSSAEKMQFTSYDNIELGKKWIKCNMQSIALYISEIWTLRKFGGEIFG